MNRRIRILVVDDHVLFRRGLVGLLAENPNLTIVGEAGNGKEALELMAQVNPDLLLLDINMPVMDGVEVVEALHSHKNRPKVLMLTISQQEEDLLGAIVAGADGYLLKSANPEELMRGIELVMEGKSVLAPEVTRAVMRAAAAPKPQMEQNPLSERELEVLHCLADGFTTPKIATELFISENTVKTHIRHILEKMEAANRTEAVMKAMQKGLIAQK